MPFVTAFMGAITERSCRPAVYWGWMVLIALLNLRVNAIATGPAMLGAGARPPEAAADVPPAEPQRRCWPPLTALG